MNLLPRLRRAALMSLVGGLSALSLAHAQPQDRLVRGELLYNTHCGACHTAQMHWRGSKLVSDWDTLKQQVRRWQATAALNWSEDDITSVALYLNRQHYGYPVDRYGQQTLPTPTRAAASR